MIINKEALDNSTFFLYSNENIKENEYMKEIDELIEKYHITANNNLLTQSDENKFIAIINYTSNLYYHNQELPNDLRIIFLKNYPFKKSVNIHLEKKISNLIKNDSAIFFKEITSMIHILCLGENYEIFNSYNSYNYNAISELFRFYEDTLRTQKENKELFDTTFQSYIILLSAYTQLCVINSTDIIRKKSITKIVDLMTETINMLKFSITLEDSEINKINNILGEHLYYFSHLTFIKIKKDDINYTINEYYLFLERQIDGYELSKSSNFGEDNLHSKNEEYIIFKNNASYLLLTLLQKIDMTLKDYDYFSNKSFLKIRDLYYKKFSLKTKEISTDKNIKEFKLRLLNSLSYKNEISSQKVLTHKTIIDDFIVEGSKFSNTNLETIHNILLFSKDIEDYKYLNIAQILVNTTSIQNDYHEYFKLKTFDVIINSFVNKKNTEDINELFLKIYNYITINKTASHLLSTYSKIYLSLCLYYSYYVDNKELMEKGKTYYAIFIQTNGVKILKEEYSSLNSKVLLNFAKYYKKILQLTNFDLSSAQDIKLSKEIIKQYLVHRELKLKAEISQGITKLTNDIYTNPTLNYKNIHNVLVDLISNKIFNGLSQVYIQGLENEKINLSDVGYKKYSIKMSEEYSIIFIFPTIYEENFIYVLNYNKDFIKSNMDNILRALNKHNINYIDSNTKLFNSIKLQHLLKSSTIEKLNFIEISIPTINEINEINGFKSGNKILKDIATKISQISGKENITFKLEGNKFGILLKNIKNYEEIIEKLTNIQVEIDNNYKNIQYHLAITSANKNDLINKSSNNIDKAIINKMKQVIDIN